MLGRWADVMLIAPAELQYPGQDGDGTVRQPCWRFIFRDLPGGGGSRYG